MRKSYPAIPLLERLYLSSKALSLYGEHELVESIIQNLTTLFNSHRIHRLEGLGYLPHVRRSGYCFGVIDPQGVGGDKHEYARLLEQAICNFEPRLLPESVCVTPAAADTSRMNPALWYFVIGGELAVPESSRAVRLYAVFDLETGYAAVTD